jgi:hypothetical protein
MFYNSSVTILPGSYRALLWRLKDTNLSEFACLHNQRQGLHRKNSSGAATSDFDGI